MGGRWIGGMLDRWDVKLLKSKHDPPVSTSTVPTRCRTHALIWAKKKLNSASDTIMYRRHTMEGDMAAFVLGGGVASANLEQRMQSGGNNLEQHMQSGGNKWRQQHTRHTPWRGIQRMRPPQSCAKPCAKHGHDQGLGAEGSATQAWMRWTRAERAPQIVWRNHWGCKTRLQTW